MFTPVLSLVVPQHNPYRNGNMPLWESDVILPTPEGHTKRRIRHHARSAHHVLPAEHIVFVLYRLLIDDGLFFALFSRKFIDEIKGKFQVLNGTMILYEMSRTADPTSPLEKLKYAAYLGFQPLLRHKT